MIVSMKEIVKRYDDVLALDYFNLEVEKGVIYGLLGPNGCGKTTAINCMLSLTKYDNGSVDLFSEPMSSNRYDLKKRIGLVPQEIGVYDTLSVYDNIDYFCGLYINEPKLRKQYVEQALEFVGLDTHRKRRPNQLSGGLRRRLNLACGIAHQPDLIILDEPTVAVDPQSRNHILSGIQNLAAQGRTIIYTTHYMEEVEFLCDQITIMDRGKTLVTGTSDEIKALSSAGEVVRLEIYDLSADHLAGMEAIGNISHIDYQDSVLQIHFLKGTSRLQALLHYLEKQELNVLNLSVQKPSLNDVFLEITGKELRDND